MEGDLVTTKRAVVVRGGWDGHQPVEATELFLPFLRENGYDVRVEESPAVYADADAMAATDLIVQCVTMSTIEREQVAGLRAAVEAGTGLHRLARRHRRLVPRTRPTTCSWSAGSSRRTPARSPTSADGRPERQLPRRTRSRSPTLGRRAPDHRGHRRLRAHHRAVLGAARRPQRRARHHDASGPAVASVAPADHLAGDLDPRCGARAASS